MRAKLTPTEKCFKAKLAQKYWHTYRDQDSGRLVTNFYRGEVAELSAVLKMPLEIVLAGAANFVKVAAVEPQLAETN